jgi:hypothetical protein
VPLPHVRQVSRIFSSVVWEGGVQVDTFTAERYSPHTRQRGTIPRCKHQPQKVQPDWFRCIFSSMDLRQALCTVVCAKCPEGGLVVRLAGRADLSCLC